MKSLAFAIVIGTALVGLTATSARADDLARVTVPFAFKVDNQTLPAGQYDIRSDTEGSSVVSIIGVDHHAYADAVTIPDYTMDSKDRMPALTFVRKNGVMQLSEIHEDDGYARQLVPAGTRS